MNPYHELKQIMYSVLTQEDLLLKNLLWKWIVLFHQMNLFDDHTKLVLNHNESDHLITYINEERIASTYRLVQVTHHGCSSAIAKRLHLARERMQEMMGVSSDVSEEDIVEESTDL